MQFTVRGFIPAQPTAGTTQNNAIGRVPRPGTVTGWRVLPNATSALNATNNRVLTVQNRNKTDGTGTESVGTMDTVATALTAFVSRAGALSGTPANLVVAAGDILALVETIGGTGVAHGGFHVEVTIDPTYGVN